MSTLDPEIEELFEDQARRREARVPLRAVAVEAVAAVTLALAVLGLVSLFPDGGFASPLVLAALVVGFAVASGVRFDFGLGYTTPVQVIFVPMWFAVPAPYLPVLVVLGMTLHKLAGIVRGERRPIDILLAVPDAWYSVGPALVLGTAGLVEPTFSDWPIFVAAFAAQVLVDAAVSTARGWAELGVAPDLQLRVMGWVWVVDGALAPVGLLAAVAMASAPATIICLLPLLGLLAVFARERDARIRQALQLSGAYRGTAILLGDVLEADDAYTGGEHTQGVVELGLAVGRELGLDAQALRDLEFGSLLHDIGKLRVSNEIINKPGKLTEAEWEIIRRHPVDGQEMLSRVGGALEKVGEIVRAHHERVDGGGYPDGLEGDAIPMEARIICVCDAYSAMTTTRAYRPAMPRADAIEELRRCAGQQFDVRVVEALIQVVERVPETSVPHLRLAA